MYRGILHLGWLVSPVALAGDAPPIPCLALNREHR
jgi:hypothetical protein